MVRGTAVAVGSGIGVGVGKAVGVCAGASVAVGSSVNVGGMLVTIWVWADGNGVTVGCAVQAANRKMVMRLSMTCAMLGCFMVDFP